MSQNGSTPYRLVAVLGSATPPGRLHRLIGGAIVNARTRFDADARLIDLATVAIAPADGRPPESLGDDTADVISAVYAADAVVLATPIYRASLTGILKNLLDQLPVDALRGTPVGIVAMGGSDHHYLAADSHLSDILAFFGALVLPNAAYATSADFTDGVPSERAVAEVDAVFTGVLSLATALAGAGELGPPPILARPRAGTPAEPAEGGA